MPVQSRLDHHIRDAQKSAKLLQKARDDANKTREGGYCSAAVRAKIRNEFAKRNPGKIAHPWQVNIGEALELGLDCSLLAGTGSGKTIPFVMPLFSQLDKIVIIISPLNALEEDQVRAISAFPALFSLTMSDIKLSPRLFHQNFCLGSFRVTYYLKLAIRPPKHL